MAVAGGTLAGIGNLVDDAFGVSASGLLSAPGGFGLVMGLLTAGGSALATPPPWRWMGVGLVLVAIGIAIGEHAGSALVDLSWIALAFPARQATRDAFPGPDVARSRAPLLPADDG